MLTIRAVVSACAVLASLTTCDSTQTLDIRLRQNVPLELAIWQKDATTSLMQQKTVVLPPYAPEYRRFEEWLATNQKGWRKLPFEKGPPDGIFVTAGDLRFHFHLRGVTLSRGGETFYKDIRDDEYAFLKPPAGI